jgi:hypothetical protein
MPNASLNLAEGVALLALLSSCASHESVQKQANDDVSSCLRNGQVRVEVVRCLSSVGFPDDKIRSARTSVVATRCRASGVPGFGTCAIFEGQFDADGRLTTWHVAPGYDRP